VPGNAESMITCPEKGNIVKFSSQYAEEMITFMKKYGSHHPLKDLF
jgi:hypothetical protein